MLIGHMRYRANAAAFTVSDGAIAPGFESASAKRRSLSAFISSDNSGACPSSPTRFYVYTS